MNGFRLWFQLLPGCRVLHRGRLTTLFRQGKLFARGLQAGEVWANVRPVIISQARVRRCGVVNAIRRT